MPGVARASNVTSISTRAGVAPGFTFCAASLRGKTSCGLGSRSAPSMTMVVGWPIVRPRRETLLICGAAVAGDGARYTAKANAKEHIAMRLCFFEPSLFMLRFLSAKRSVGRTTVDGCWRGRAHPKLKRRRHADDGA